MKEINITANEGNQRMDRFLKKYLPKASSGFLYKMLRKKRIKLNGRKAGAEDIIKEGDTLQFYLSEETINKFRNNIMIKRILVNFKIIYEDDNIILINKDKGILSHSASENDENTLVDQLISYLYDKGEYKPTDEKTFKPSICNRLDRNTGGIVIGAKNYLSLQSINKAIRMGELQKYYKCLVKGKITRDKELMGYLVKDNDTNRVYIKDEEVKGSKKIHTLIKVLKNTDKYSLLEIDLKTGRTHQIRAHLSSIGHPVIGDYKYGDKKYNTVFKREYELGSQFLYAHKIIFNGLQEQLEYLNGKEFKAELDKKLKIIEDNIFHYDS